MSELLVTNYRESSLDQIFNFFSVLLTSSPGLMRRGLDDY